MSAFDDRRREFERQIEDVDWSIAQAECRLSGLRSERDGLVGNLEGMDIAHRLLTPSAAVAPEGDEECVMAGEKRQGGDRRRSPPGLWPPEGERRTANTVSRRRLSDAATVGQEVAAEMQRRASEAHVQRVAPCDPVTQDMLSAGSRTLHYVYSRHRPYADIVYEVYRAMEAERRKTGA